MDLLWFRWWGDSLQTQCVTALGSSILLFSAAVFIWAVWRSDTSHTSSVWGCEPTARIRASGGSQCFLFEHWLTGGVVPQHRPNCNRQQSKKYINATILCLEQSNYKRKLLGDEEGKQKWCFSPLKLLQPRLPPSWFLLDASYSALCFHFRCLNFYHFTQRSVFSSLYSENQSQAVFSVQPNISPFPPAIDLLFTCIEYRSNSGFLSLMVRR